MNKTSKILVALTIIFTSFACTFLYKKNIYIKEEKLKESIFADIINRYDKYIKTVNETPLYILENDNYIENGIVNKDVILELEEIPITYETKYFKLKNSNFYIKYQDVIRNTNGEISNRYKKYILYNKNIITKEVTNFYDEKDNLVFTINSSFEFPIIVNTKNKYGVEYLNRLLYVKKEDVSKTKNVTNTKEKTRTKIRVLTYHTVYQKGKEKCDNYTICHSTEQFEEHMKYLHDNNYFTLTMEELEMFLNNQIRIPKKSIVVTLDDGRRIYNSIPIAEKYQVDATFFIITGVNSVTEYLGKVKYSHFESHSDNLHNNYVCKGGFYGSQLLCTSYDDLVKDFKTCIEKLGGESHYFAYPFFDSNATIIKALKATGYRLAFVGEADSDGYSTPQTDKYQIRRKTIFGNDSLKTFKSYLPESE